MVGSLFSQHYLWNEAYYHLMEFGFISYLISFYLLSKDENESFSKLWQTIVLIIMLSSVSVLVDELFYNAQLLEWNDLFRITLIIITSIKIKYKIKWKIFLKH